MVQHQSVEEEDEQLMKLESQTKINIEEFEEIADCYDQIREISLQRTKDREHDKQLQRDFDTKLKDIMKLLSSSLKDENTSFEEKKLTSLKSKAQLYYLCFSKAQFFLDDQIRDLFESLIEGLIALQSTH